MATVIFGIGLLVGSLVYVSQPAQVAGNPSLSLSISPLCPPWSAGLPAWSIANGDKGIRDQGSGIREVRFRFGESRQSPIPRFPWRKFALSSGLLEITYDTGAKVALQGPATYQVESANGGFLPVGKLLGKVDNRDGQRLLRSHAHGRGGRSWYGVWRRRGPRRHLRGPRIERSRETSSATRWAKRLSRCDCGKARGGGINACRTRPTGTSSGQVTAIAINRMKFEPMRVDEAGQSQCGAGRRTAGSCERIRPWWRTIRSSRPAKDMRRCRTCPLRASALDGQVEGAEWVYGRLPGKYALYFHGPGSGDKVVLPEQERFKFTGPFSVAVWFRVERFTAMTHTLVAKGDTSWRLHQDKRTKQISFDTSREPFVDPFWDVTAAPTESRRWPLALGGVGVRARRQHGNRKGIHRRLFGGRGRIAGAFPAEQRARVAWGRQRSAGRRVLRVDRRGGDLLANAVGRRGRGDVRGRQPGRNGYWKAGSEEAEGGARH